MADPRRRSVTTRVEISIWAAKLAVLLIGMVSIALFARIAIPYSVGLFASVLPRFWSAVRGWLVPPYLFITVHLIIITIWKLSDHKLQRDHRPEEEKSHDAPLLPVKPRDVAPSPPIPLLQKTPPEIRHGFLPADAGEDKIEHDATTPPPAPNSGGAVPKPASESCLTTESGEKSASTSTASSRLEIKEEDDDAIEARWKAIKEGGTAPPGPAAAAAAAGGFRSEAAGRKERDGSGSGHDEWDRRFEAFIRKNYKQIRLQNHHESHRRDMRRTNRS